MLESICLNLYNRVYAQTWIGFMLESICLTIYISILRVYAWVYMPEFIRKYWLGLFLSLEQKNWSVYSWVYTPTLTGILLEFISDHLSVLCLNLYPNISRVYIFCGEASYHYAVSSVGILIVRLEGCIYKCVYN